MMKLYFLEMVEDGYRLPKGKAQGYETLEEAETEAQKHVDDALPRNYIRIFGLISSAHLGGDGEPYIQKALPQVDFCNWCPDPKNPSPEYHPNGQVEHSTKIKENG